MPDAETGSRKSWNGEYFVDWMSDGDFPTIAVYAQKANASADWAFEGELGVPAGVNESYREPAVRGVLRWGRRRGWKAGADVAERGRCYGQGEAGVRGPEPDPAPPGRLLLPPRHGAGLRDLIASSRRARWASKGGQPPGSLDTGALSLTGRPRLWPPALLRRARLSEPATALPPQAPPRRRRRPRHR